MESLTKSKLKNYNISFKQYTHIIEILYNFNIKLRNKLFNESKYSTLCKRLLNITNYIETHKIKQLNLLKVVINFPNSDLNNSFSKCSNLKTKQF